MSDTGAMGERERLQGLPLARHLLDVLLLESTSPEAEAEILEAQAAIDSVSAAVVPFTEASRDIRPDDADTMRPAIVQAVHFRRLAATFSGARLAHSDETAGLVEEEAHALYPLDVQIDERDAFRVGCSWAARLVDQVFTENINDQAERVKVFPRAPESPGCWIQRVRHAAIRAALAMEPSNG